MRPASTVTPSGSPESRASSAATGTATRIPGEPRLAELPHHARAPLLLVAERGPPPQLLELPQEVGPPQDAGRPDELRPEHRHQLRRPRPRHPEQFLDVPPREQVPVQLLELPDGVGDGEEPPGRGRHQAGLV